MMKKIVLSSVLVVLVAGCVSVPTGSNVLALPGTGKSYEQFRHDEAICQQYAREKVGPYAPQAVADNAVGTTTAGTLIGAAAGALIGAASGNAGAGAAIGAGSGLLVGSSIASDSTVHSSRGIQHQYNKIYSQCMYAKGNKIPVSSHAVAPVYTTPPAQSGIPPDYVEPHLVPPDYRP